MSFDNRFQAGEGSQGSSRHSSSLARLAFNIYGNSSTSSNNTTSISPNRTYPIPRNNTSPQHHHDSHHGAYQGASRESQTLRYKSTQELIGMGRINDENYDAVVIAGKNMLEVLRIDNNSIVAVNDLLSNNYHVKNKKQMGSILDVKCGFHHYNKYIATSTTTGSIFVFNNTGSDAKSKVLFKLTGHTRAVNSICFSQLDQSLLLSGSQDGAVKLWDLRSNSTKAISSMNGNSDAVRGIQFSPFHNKKMVAIFDSGVIQKWDLRNPNQFERKFNAHTGPVLSIDWHPDLDYIVSGGRDKQIQVWNMNNNDTRKLPEHVIYTSAPVNKVSFKPNSNSITNILNAEIATSFLTNDSSIQLYSLKRKYIPKLIIENHSAQITGLCFKDEKTLLSCSKDKNFIKQDITTLPNTVDNLPLSSISWQANNDFVYFTQSKYDTNEYSNLNSGITNNNNNDNNNTGPMMNSTSPSSSIHNSPMNNLTSGKNSPDQSSPRPGISRASSFRPNNIRNNTNNYVQSTNLNNLNYNLNPDATSNTYLIPIELPISNSIDNLKYLSSNYIIDKNSQDLIDICIKNSEISGKVKNYRDARTWLIIKESLIWESQYENDLIYEFEKTTMNGRDDQGKNKNEHNEYNKLTDQDEADSESVNDGDYHYSTSNSTNYGKSPGLSDLSEFNSVNSKEFPLQRRLSSLRKSFSNVDDIQEEDELKNDEIQTWTKENIQRELKLQEEFQKSSAENHEQQIENKDDNDDAIEFVSSVSKPIELPNTRKPRNSLLESILPQNSSVGNHTSNLGKSSSPSYSISSSLSNPMSNQSSFKPSSALSYLKSPMFTKLSKLDSHKSELTRQLTTQNLTQKNTVENSPIITAQDEIEAAVTKKSTLVPPYSPNLMIKKAVEFSCNQGDLIMSCTLLLLFNEKYKIMEEIIFTNLINEYLQFLKRLQFFNSYAKVVEACSIDEFKEQSLNSTTVRRFCYNCGALVINEKSKQLYLKDAEIKFGSWYCDNCGERSKCIYCNEPVKGLTCFRLKCGHNGHFKCFKTWLIEENMDCCPAGCLE